MGKKGKPSRSKGGRAKQSRSSGGGGLGRLAGAAASAAGGFGVDKQGRVMPAYRKPRRKKGYRMPKYIAESMRAQNEMLRTMQQVMMLNAVSHK